VKPGFSKSTKTVKTLWIGRDHALQIGGARPKSGNVTDQSDAWACLSITGADTNAVLARLCPVDLPKMKAREVARTLINHLSAIILATPQGYEILVFRAFARTLVHELQEAANAVEGRKRLGL
jgi:sarcosine oxidase subunit gamma